MVRGSLLIHGPPVISGAGCPTRVVTACPPNGTARTARSAATPTAVVHVHSVFMVLSLAPPRLWVSRPCQFYARVLPIEGWIARGLPL